MGWVTKLGPGRCRFLLPERSRFSQIGHIIFRAVVALKTSVPFTCRFVACSSRIKVEQTDRQTDRETDTQTDRPSTVTLAAHARRGLTTQCESSSGVPAASKDICHTLETTATPYSTQTTVPSSMAISKSERAATLQVPPSEKATKIPLTSNGIHKTVVSRAKSTQCVFPL